MKQILLDQFTSNHTLMRVLETACANESYLKQGQNFGRDLLFKAHLESNTGLWLVIIETPIGNISIKELEHNHIIIKSIDIKEITNSYIVDYSRAQDLKQLKTKLADDQIFSNILIESFGNRSLAEVFVVLFQNFRKELKEYQSKYRFLWDAFGIHNAQSLANLITERSLKLSHSRF